MSAFDHMPDATEVEHAAAVLRGAAAQLAVWRELDLEGNLKPSPEWEAPNGGPPAPGAADEALGLVRVAATLEGLSGPLAQFAAAMESGMSPMDFLLASMNEPASITDTKSTDPQEG